MSLKLQYNITEWPNWGLNYWGIPKCANTSIKAALQLKKFERPHETHAIVHAESFSKYIDKQTAMNNGLINFTVIRHPFSRICSLYNDFCEKRKGTIPEVANLSFDEFIEYLSKTKDEECNIHFRSQYSFISHEGKIIPSAIKLETLSDGLVLYFGRNIFPTLQKLNTTNTLRYLSNKNKAKIYNRYEQDFLKLGYTLWSI